jgi:DNA-binding GntR family transcriptional regulator
LREALKVLAAEGSVELLPNRGARVSLFSSREVHDMFEVMGALEGLAGELAATNISEEELIEIVSRHRAMLDAYQRRDVETYYTQNEAIHEAILAAARNPLLSNVYRGLSARIRRLRFAAKMSPERWTGAIREHEAMLAALRMRDGSELAAILRMHVRNKCEVVVATFAREEAERKAAG